ncbi:MAG: EAL domain-containing protein [Pseudomonadota bacterium]
MNKLSIFVFLAAWALLSGALGVVIAATHFASLVGAIVGAALCFTVGALALTLAAVAAQVRAVSKQQRTLKNRLERSEGKLAALGDATMLVASQVKAFEETFSPPSTTPQLALDHDQTDLASVETAPAGPTLAEQIASAILGNRIDLHVQSVHALPSRRPVFFECLSRLRNDAGDVLYPSKFLDYAARSRLITTLDNFLLLRCVQIVRQFGRRASLETFFINLSATSLRDPEFFDQFVDFLSSNRALCDHIVLEFSAPSLPDCLSQIGAGLERLRRTGYLFSLDQALPTDLNAQVAALGVSYVKIAARHIVQNDAASSLLASAKAHDLVCIATHVEDEKTLIDVIEQGLSHAQGYVFGRPRAWEDVLISKGLMDAA